MTLKILKSAPITLCALQHNKPLPALHPTLTNKSTVFLLQQVTPHKISDFFFSETWTQNRPEQAEGMEKHVISL